MEKETVSLQDALDHGLTAEEFSSIQNILGRVPNSTELGIFSAMWSEHCSYKNSILKLKTLPTESEKLIAKAGEENAGGMDIGDGLAVVFKIESHNHPTAVEPYQGAATGVGGIMRDIFTMGARPIVSLNSLRFGEPTEDRNKYLLSRAVKGIGDYGNSLGIAVGGGELFIDPIFSKNPLVNAMTVGIAEIGKTASATTGSVIGAKVFIVGATTGRDGIHGASFASQDLTKETESKRSAVQVGDPFMEKLLMEASLAAIQANVLIGIQDMGAAGISCATSEMSAKGGTGMFIDLDKVPFRESGMNAYEAMLSESQERMLVVAIPGKEQELISIFEKWELNIVEIGTVTDDKLLVIQKDGEIKAKIPAESLVLGGGAPRYKREERRPGYLDEVSKMDLGRIPDFSIKELESRLESLLGSWNIGSRKPLFEQYDQEVGLVKVIPPGTDGGLVRIPGTKKGIGVATDCNSRYTYLDPYQGAAWAVCEAARNVVVTGANPYGVTNNLNFGNPYIPENYYVFSECVRGMGDACRALGLPVTGGNVSFYNESSQGPVFPTPTIGMVGYLPNVEKAISPAPKTEGIKLALIGRFLPTLGGSEYLSWIHKQTLGKIPELDLNMEKNLIQWVYESNQQGLIHSAKDLSLGGLLVALSKTCFHSKLGIRIQKLPSGFRNDELFFGETGACILLGYDPSRESEIRTSLEKTSLGFFPIGETISQKEIQLPADFGEISLPIPRLQSVWEKALETIFA
jgi:phosphoribosylformylglycinamidine synthase